MNIYVSNTLLAHTNCKSLNGPLAESDGELCCCEERHRLHQIVGSLGNSSVALFGLKQSELQNLISSRDVYRMMEVGLLQVCSREKFELDYRIRQSALEEKDMRYVVNANFELLKMQKLTLTQAQNFILQALEKRHLI